MRIIKFFEEFPDEQTCKLHFKDEREKGWVLFVRIVKTQNIIGLRQNGNGNVLSVVLGHV